jgi:hypothetical protein
VALSPGTDFHKVFFADLAPVLRFKELNIEVQFADLVENCVLKQASLRCVPLLEPALATLIRRNIGLQDPPRLVFLQKLFFLEKLVALTVALEMVSLIFGVKREVITVVYAGATADTLFDHVSNKLSANVGAFFILVNRRLPLH